MPLIESRSLSMVCASASNFDEHAPSNLLQCHSMSERRRARAALDDIRNRLGSMAITRVALLGRDRG
jgi:hypothetical protein